VRRRGFHVFLNNRLTYGCEVSLTRQATITVRKILVLISVRG
jgi:hypothetical protein